jgi:arylsulfatase A-like enzyme
MNSNNRNNSLKNVLANGFYITILWGISFGLYEWGIDFAQSATAEAYLSVILIFNLTFLIIVWTLTGLGIYLYLSLRKSVISDAGVSWFYLMLLVTLLVAVNLYSSSRTLIATHNPIFSISIFSFIVVLLITAEGVSLHYLGKKFTQSLVAHFPIHKWVKFLTPVMLILVCVYILKPRFEDLLQTSGPGTIESKPNIVLLTLDTLRADHLSCYGYERETSPFIDKIANEGILFEECIATSSWTLPSHASLFTGLFPSEHGAIYSAEDKSKTSQLPDELTTLAEIVKQKGYKTAGFIGGPYLASVFGMGQGFDSYNDRLGPIGKVYFDKITFFRFILEIFKNKINLYKLSSSIETYLIYVWNYIYGESFTKNSIGHVGWKKKANEINAVVLPWIKRNKDTRFFLFINYFDPHAPYALPKGYKNHYNRGYKSKLGGLVSQLNNIMYRRYSPTEDDLNFLISLYDSQINFLDLHIKQLFDTLVSCGIDKKTIVVITSDHGEAFGEHGLMQHGFSLYEDQIKVPLILWGIKKFPDSQRISTQVQIIDIMPTILNLINIPPPENIRGQSLIPLIAGREDFARPYALAEMFEDKAVYRFGEEYRRDLKCIRTREWKYIASSRGKKELYNVIEDREEMNNLKDAEKEVSKNMEDLIKKIAPSFKGKYNAKAKSFQIDNDIKEQLRGLGYINSED